MSDILTREYVDNFSFKEYTQNELVPKYFPDISPSLRTVGMIGMTTEQIANIEEDTFNSLSVLIRETFPNRAQLPENIYSHAALFQLSDIFSSASVATFILVIDEKAIIDNMSANYDVGTGIYHFYVDKDTVIYVEDIPFTIDYDIDIKIVKKTTEFTTDYIYSASYLKDEYENSMSKINDPYIKVRKSPDGFILLEIDCHQCTRSVSYETILTNSTINYPIIDVNFDGKIAGFDILYKPPGSTEFSTQLTPLVVYSQPINTPFCYYRLFDEDTLRITFNTKDDYFSPEYSGELKIIIYTTLGKDGEFETYTGNNVSITTSEEKYTYTSSVGMIAKVVSSSVGGRDRLSLEALQRLSVEQFRTANALTTDHDLAEFFSNFKYEYGNSDVKFVKRRDDISERLYSSFIIMKNNDYIYKTNTLNIDLNIDDMVDLDETVYTISPGTLFTVKDDDPTTVTFLRDKDKYNEYFELYKDAVKDGTIPYIESGTDIPEYLNREASYSTFIKRNGYDDKITIFNSDKNVLSEYDDPQNGKFLYVNPYLIRFTKSPNLISLYMTYVNEHSVVDFTAQNNDSFVQFIMYQVNLTRNFSKNKSYDISLTLTPSININNDTPIIAQEIVHNDELDIDEAKYILGDRYSTHNNDLRVFMVFTDKVDNICYTELYPTKYDNTTEAFTFSGSVSTDDSITSNGKLKMVDNKIYRNPDTGEYYKVNPLNHTLYTHFDSEDIIIEDNVPVDTVTGLITSGELVEFVELVNMTSSESSDILINMSNVECKIYTVYRRIYSEESGSLIPTLPEQGNNIFIRFDNSLKNYIWTNEYSTISEPLTFVKPLNSVRCPLEYKDYTLLGQHPDFPEKRFVHDIMDARIQLFPFIKWDIASDNEKIGYFMSSFLSQYNDLTKIINTRLRGSSNLDIKLYNTYGPSKNFTIGEDNAELNTVNLSIEFDVWFVNGTDTVSKSLELKRFIKSEIEKLNGSTGTNSVYISNLMRKMETQFSYIDHIRFISINKKPSTYQSVRLFEDNIEDLSVKERQKYVPELLNIDLADIKINDYLV